MAKRSVVLGASVAVAAVAIAAAATGLSLSSNTPTEGKTTVTVNLWDDAVAAAYKQSFAKFEAKNKDIDVKVHVTPWATYWDTLLVDVGGGTASDIFWLNSTFTPYADHGNLVNVSHALGAGADHDWDPSVVAQYTRDESLWGVPQLADGGKAILYNKKLVAAAGLSEADLAALVWAPAGGHDTLTPSLQKLTLDAGGHSAGSPGFDATTIKQFGYNAAYDRDAILYNFIGSGGGKLRSAAGYTFAQDSSVKATQYVVDLINKYHVAPSAADTNDNPDFSKDQFLQGKLALFQTGLYNLASVSDGASFDWGVVPAPKGPAGALSVTNGIIAAGNAASAHPKQTQRVLEWLGSTEGSAAIGATGSAVPAVLGAQKPYFDAWHKKGVDVSPFFRARTFTLPVLNSTHVSEADAELDPVFKEVFLGRLDVATGLRQAQDAANAALKK